MSKFIELQKVIKGAVEHRFDPLTRQETRINPARANRPKQGESGDPFEEIAKKSQDRCPFCPERILEKVPKFDASISADGRIKRNQALIFPNLSPFGSSHAVGVMCDAHYLPIDKFEAWMLKDSFLAAQEYIHAVHKTNSSIRYPVIVWNFLPPSAGSIIHPHIQMLVEDDAVPALGYRMSQAAAYHKTNRRNYFLDLLEHERNEKERYIGGNDTVQAIATFAPRGVNEVEFIFPGVASFTALNEKQVADFADVLLKALEGYKSLGIGSFNLASYSAAVNEATREDFCLHAKLFSRPAPNGVYTNDTGPMERMYDSWVIDSVPEKMAEALRPFFSPASK
eukprot:TRINITY_DN4499_c0_g2_i1.p1 TRINITY_DN4499_c0_g2~~TRINITY_DN4499_c0_g2_i1.p1  ORF type:complete len:339 (-),score=72.51 TRINITY_DN4499_c0_g2_i1:25-1041(-)